MSESDATSSGEPESTSGATTSDPPTTDSPTTGSTSDAPTTDPTTGPDSSTGDSTTDSLCLEFNDEAVDAEPEAHFTCGLPLLCGGGEPVFFFKELGNTTTDDIDTARCLAAALRDRTLGTIQYQQPSLGHHITSIEILGEQVVRRDDWLEDFNWTYDEKVTSLRPTDFFTDCAEGSAFAVFNCLEDAFLDECAGQLECPP